MMIEKGQGHPIRISQDLRLNFATFGTDFVHFAMENENRSDVLSMQGKRKKCKLMDSANFEVDPFVVPKGVVSLAINWDYLQKVSSF